MATFQCSNTMQRSKQRREREREGNIINSFKERVTALLKRSCYCASSPLPSLICLTRQASYTARRFAPGAFPLSAQIYDDAAYIPSGHGTVLPLKSLPPRLRLLVPSFLSSLRCLAQEHRQKPMNYSHGLCPWENTRVAPVGIVNATANCARRRRRGPTLWPTSFAEYRILSRPPHPALFRTFLSLRFGTPFVRRARARACFCFNF